MKSPDPAPVVFDREAALTYTNQDHELYREVIGLFSEHWPADLETIRSTTSAGDVAGLRFAAHRLKGQCALVGGTEASACALALEMIGDSGDLTGAMEKIELLAAALGKLNVEIKGELNS